MKALNRQYLNEQTIFPTENLIAKESFAKHSPPSLLNWEQILAKSRANRTHNGRRVAEFLDFEEIHYKEQHSVSFYANLLHIQKDYLRQLCRKVLGQTPIQCTASKLLFEATRLLTEGEYSIIEISRQLGFDSHSQFDHLFKKYKGMSPSDYRKQILG